MKYGFRITHELLSQIHADLSRPHRFAFERVGFIRCQVGIHGDRCVVLAESYQPIEDDDYLESDTMGALMGPAAIRKALQEAYRGGFSMFHVHRHDHHGVPEFSRVDVQENAKFVPDFWKVAPTRPHGAIVLSWNAATGAAWDPVLLTPIPLSDITSIGSTLVCLGGSHE